MKHLHQINNRFVVRVVVPPDLRTIIGKRELREWLGADKKSAERNAPAIIARFYAVIDAAQAKRAAQAPTIGTAARAHYDAELVHDDRERAVSGNAAKARQSHLFRAGHASKLRLLAAGQLDLEEADALLGWAADDLMESGKAKPGDNRMDLLKGLAEAQLEALARFEERDAGKVSLTPPSAPILQPEEQPETEAPSPRRITTGRTLSDMLKDFHTERTAGGRSLSPKTMDEHKVAVRMLEEFLGQGTPAASITKQDMLAYKRALLETPANYRQRFPGKWLLQAIEANKARAEPFPTLNATTINDKWLSHVSTIMAWCEANSLLPNNVARGVKVDQGKGFKEPTRTAFSGDDLKRIFGTPLFADPATYGTRQWALLVALYTGARSSSEIARIKLTDIYQEQGVWVFNLEDASKNLRSKRLVPIHNALIKLGLLRYVEKLRRTGAVRLFPDWEPEDKVNRWFLRTYLPAVGIRDSRKVFHSFRHSLKTALARHGVNRDVSDLITGHKDQSVGGIYIGDASVTMISAMHEGLNRVELIDGGNRL